MRFTAVVMPALFLVVGCVGSDFDGGGGGGGGGVDAGGGGSATAGATLYKSTVHSVMTAKCSGAACHSQTGAVGVYGFATTDATASYTQITGVPTIVGTYTSASAGLLTKVKAGHNAVVYSSDEESKITAWLAKEVQDRGGTIVDPVQALKDWSGCMNIDDFKLPSALTTPPKTMTLAWGQLATITTQACKNCHQAGLNSFLSGDGANEDNFFLGISTQKDFLLKYFTVDGTGTVVINTASMQNAGVTLPQHPRFNALTNDGMTVLKSFYDLTMARKTAGTCGTPKLIDP